MTTVLDDLDARPGSATSLLRTVIGSNLRAHGGWLPTTTLVALMGELGVSPQRTRTALSRLKGKGLLRSQSDAGLSGYAITPAALVMLGRGDRRIFEPRVMGERDRWCLISFSVPEQRRDLRHQLRKRLSWIGCGTVAAALWICPEYLTGEVEAIVAELKLTGQVSVFLADEARLPDLERAVASWWDLGAVRALHDRFLAEHASAPAEFYADPQPRTAFRVWTTALDAWRSIPYLDPGLPASLLPADWPGDRSAALFMVLRDGVRPAALEFVASLAEMAPGVVSGPPPAGTR